MATAYTSLLFAIPAAVLRGRAASALFWALTPVSFAVHALGGKGWRVRGTRWGRALVLADKALANAAAVATVAGVATGGSALTPWAVPFWLSAAYCGAAYHLWYPRPPRCWVAHHAAFHAAVVHGCLWAAACGA